MSNLLSHPRPGAAGARLCQATFADYVFFANSGAEAVEGAIKIARRYHFSRGAPERYRIVTFEGAFHGRTLATISAGGQAKHLEGFGPPADGFDHVAAGDYRRRRGCHRRRAPPRVMIEPMQGEGGMRAVSWPSFCGICGRFATRRACCSCSTRCKAAWAAPGKLFAHEWAGITPDIMASAKGLGGGFPVGAVLATEEVATGMTPGSHGSTFGGNPLAMAVGNAVLDVVLAPGFLDHVAAMGLRLKQRLDGLKDEHGGIIEEIRGQGLMLGLKCKVPNQAMLQALAAERMLTVQAGDNVVRLLPPLIVGEAEIDEACAKIEAACVALESWRPRQA